MHRYLLGFLVTSLLGACVATVGARGGGPPPPPPTEVRDHRPAPRFIEGTVYDAQTRQPIDRAAVDITFGGSGGEETVNTGPDGRFRTRDIPPGEFHFRCRRDGYEPFLTQGVIRQGVARVDCALVRKRR